MKKYLFSLALMIGFVSTSCTQDEPSVPIVDMPTDTAISFSVTADGGSRSLTSYQNGTDITNFYVSAWVTAPNIKQDSILNESTGKKEWGNVLDENGDPVRDRDENGNFVYPLPGYGSPNTNNASFFTNDKLVRKPGDGVFNYATDARYWPKSDNILDFFAVVDNDSLSTPLSFGFSAVGGKPGLDGTIYQKGRDEMPDLLYATAFNESLKGSKPQQNVSLQFYHAFAQVVVTAEVKNKNIRVYLTDISIRGIAKSGEFQFPYKSGEGKNTVTNPANWIVPDVYTDIEHLAYGFNESNPIILDLKETAKATLTGTTTDTSTSQGKVGKEGTLFVIPKGYSGRNSSSLQTYISLKGYVYNISNTESGFDADTDALVYPDYNKDSSITPAEMNIPIEFDWKMGTINRYNITFDCGNGGSISTDPNKPALVRIGYEVEVEKWTDGQNKDPEEFKK